MLSFYVCKCGNPQTNHHFRHPFENSIKVRKEIEAKTGFETFTLDAEDFEELKKVVCALPECSAIKQLHETPCVEHKFVPLEKTYRKLFFTVPENAKCNKNGCGVSLKNHLSIRTHSFTTRVNVENRKENDTLTVIHPDDDDIKIILE